MIKVKEETPLTVAKFIEFVADQNVDRTIDHSSGWAECAVGDFADSSADSPYRVIHEISDYDHELFMRLGNANSNEEFHTYGELSDWLKEKGYYTEA